MRINKLSLVVFATYFCNAPANKLSVLDDIMNKGMPTIQEEEPDFEAQSSTVTVAAELNFSISKTERAKIKALPEVPKRAVSPRYIARSPETIKALNLEPMRLKKVPSKK